MYIVGYRNLGIFYENAVNRILRDFVKAVKPLRARVIGEFNVRGGMKSTIEATYPPKVSNVKGKKASRSSRMPSASTSVEEI